MLLVKTCKRALTPQSHIMTHTHTHRTNGGGSGGWRPGGFEERPITISSHIKFIEALAAKKKLPGAVSHHMDEG
jgi:hypothetical protein